MNVAGRGGYGGGSLGVEGRHFSGESLSHVVRKSHDRVYPVPMELAMVMVQLQRYSLA
jgi:hypothetical protein